jgi:hypothetical protein
MGLLKSCLFWLQITLFLVNFKRDEDHSRDRTRRVRTMTLLHTVSFYATWVMSSVFFVMLYVAWNNPERGDWLYPTSSFAANAYIATVLPLQAFFDWFILYMLPRFQRLKREHPSWALRAVLWGVMFERRSENRNSRGAGEDVFPSKQGVLYEEVFPSSISADCVRDDIDGDVNDDSIMASMRYETLC